MNLGNLVHILNVLICKMTIIIEPTSYTAKRFQNIWHLEWLAHCHSYSKVFINVNFVKEINEEQKTFYKPGICSTDYTCKASRVTSSKNAIASLSPFV